MKHYTTRATLSSQLWDNVDCMLNCEKSDKICMYSFTEAKTLRPLKKFECVPPNLTLQVSNSCHGIICFYMSCGILLCNPSIQEDVILVQPCSNDGRLALGFDQFSNDYKIVAVDAPSSLDCTWMVAVYSVRSRQWRNVQINSASFEHIQNFDGTDVASNANGRFRNWLASKEVPDPSSGELMTVTSLVSFDMVEEVLKELQMPKSEDNPFQQRELLSSSRWRASLCCFSSHFWSNSSTSGFINVWVIGGNSNKGDHCRDDDDWMWSKELVVKFPFFEKQPIHPLSFWLNSKELLVYTWNKKKKSREMLHYNISTQQVTRTGRSEEPSYYSGGYVESLVSIKQFMLLHNDNDHLHYEEDEDTKQQIDDLCGDTSKQQDIVDNGFIFRVVIGRGRVGWSCTVRPLNKMSKACC